MMSLADFEIREIGCWYVQVYVCSSMSLLIDGNRSWDVCAGIVIAQEAGCVITGSHADFDSPSPFDVTEAVLTGRKYIVVRAIGDTPVSTYVMRHELFNRLFI
jgi:fructose-1,6-bisphosphatase/inositol monophosphatase family enzyme